MEGILNVDEFSAIVSMLDTATQYLLENECIQMPEVCEEFRGIDSYSWKDHRMRTSRSPIEVYEVYISPPHRYESV